ncbi:MAG: hypothetical protein LBH35_05745, partial [Treponema sp.]|nr:hypothetical protein [Treponema sp.]
MKQKISFIILFLLIVMFSGCVRPQTGIPETPPAEPSIMETSSPQSQEPLQSINERLDGTVWVSGDMWDNIPIDWAVGIRTFTKNEI